MTPTARPPRPHRWRLAAIALGATLLSGCALIVADTLPAVSRREPGFFALPVKAMLTRDSVEPKVLLACTRAECGHDVVVTLVEARGEEARRLRRSLGDARGLEALIGHRPPDNPQLRARFGLPKPVPADVRVEPAEVMGRKAMRVILSGGAKGRVAYGIIVERTAASKAAPVFVIAVSDSREAAEGYAGAALEAQ